MAAVLHFFREVVLSFIPIFVALDALGTLPILIAITSGMQPRQRSRTVRLAMFVALGLGLGFLALGKGLFLVLGIKAADFLVAGGLVLLILAARDLTTGRFYGGEETSPTDEDIGAVPIGTPLVVGPAVLTTLLLLSQQYNFFAVLLAFVTNLALAWLAFAQANRISAFLGRGGMRVASKIVSLFLAAIAVKMIRQGILQILAH